MVNAYIQQLVQIKWDVTVHGRYLYLMKLTLEPSKKFQHLARAEEVVVNTELAIPRPPSPMFCPEDPRLLVTTVVRHWWFTICSQSVQCYRKVVTNTTQLTHWILSSRQFPRLAWWSSCEKRDSSIRHESSDILYISPFEPWKNWWNFWTSTSLKTWTV